MILCQSLANIYIYEVKEVQKMATSKNNDMYSYLDQLSTQELEDLLQEDMEAADGGDLDMVMYIMEVIEKREGGISEADQKSRQPKPLRNFITATPSLKVMDCRFIPVILQTATFLIPIP